MIGSTQSLLLAGALSHTDLSFYHPALPQRPLATPYSPRRVYGRAEMGRSFSANIISGTLWEARVPRRSYTQWGLLRHKRRAVCCISFSRALEEKSQNQRARLSQLGSGGLEAPVRKGRAQARKGRAQGAVCLASSHSHLLQPFENLGNHKDQCANSHLP